MLLGIDLGSVSSQAVLLNPQYGIRRRCEVLNRGQVQETLEEIAYGLCQALARNYVATILKGRESLLPVLLTGGGFQNRGLVRVFREVLSLQDVRIRRRLARTAARLAEPGYKENLSLSGPYIGESNNDLLLLNIATIAFNGTDSPVEDNQLEAFVYQVRQRASSKSGA
jgi:hypothetical protein